MKRIPTKLLVVAVGASLLTVGCEVRTTYRPPVVEGSVGVAGEVDVNGPPPAPVIESVTVSPGPDFIWIGGAWAWGSGGWRWEGGRWGRPPHPGARWVPHRYVYRGGRHVWVRGGWR